MKERNRQGEMPNSVNFMEIKQSSRLQLSSRAYTPTEGGGADDRT